MSDEIQKATHPGLCGNCPVKVGFPLCWACVFIAIIAVTYIGNRIF